MEQSVGVRVPLSEPTEFGNLEADLRFLEASGILVPSVVALEVGSGHGALLARLRSRGLDVRGVDTNETFVNEARALRRDLPIQHTSGTSLPFADQSFDVVLSFDVFEHIADSDAHLAEVRRVLRPGGAYVLQTPNKWTNAVFETVRWRSVTRWRLDHCSLHTYGQLERRLREQGFDPVFHDVPAVTPFFRRKVRRYLGPFGLVLLAVARPDRWPRRLRTNFYVVATKREPSR